MCIAQSGKPGGVIEELTCRYPGKLAELLREIKILAVRLDLRQNDLIEEAIKDLITKYKPQEASVDVSNG